MDKDIEITPIECKNGLYKISLPSDKEPPLTITKIMEVLRESISIPYKNISEFKKEGKKMYNRLIDDNIYLAMNYYDDPTIIETKTGNVVIDLNVLKN